MKERAITFNAAEVRATLAGLKSQFRRPVTATSKDQRVWLSAETINRVERFEHRKDEWWAMAAGAPSRIVHCGPEIDGGHIGSVRCPFGMPGDRLRVRETWKSSHYPCDDEPQTDDHQCSEHCSQTYVYYAATPRVGLRPKPDGARITYLDDSTPLTDWYTSGWRSPTTMPRWASRLLLEVTDVRVQRLQDISREDVIAEGCGIDSMPLLYVARSPADGVGRTAKQAYEEFWAKTALGKRSPWARNDWVWATSYRLVAP